jgi:phosphatidate cytidylyltransferase
MKRILTALVALPILLYTVWNDTPYFFVALAALAILFGLIEFYGLAAKRDLRPWRIGGSAAAMGVVGSMVLSEPGLIVATLAALVLFSLGISLLRPDEQSRALASVSATVFGVIYVGLLASFMVGVRMIADTPTTPKLAAKLLTTFFAMVMMTDTGAYYTGRTLGRHKLAPRISPGKTIEGSIGGFITAILAGLVCRLVFFPQIPVVHVILLGGVIGIVSQIGDLAESMLKRGSEVKDSGSIFPGHGGMLDRVDSLLFCAPILYYYSKLFASRL